jgi:hypothetical protein
VPTCDSRRLLSRRHARLTRTGQRWYVEDLESTNGTSVNNVVVAERARLRDGDVLHVRDLTFRRRPMRSRGWQASRRLHRDVTTDHSLVVVFAFALSFKHFATAESRRVDR